MLIYTAYHILPVLPIKYLINEDGEPTMPFKLTTGTRPLISNLRVLYKGVKYAAPSAKGFLRYLRWNYTA